MAFVGLSPRAQADLRGLRGPRQRIVRTLTALTREPWENVDVRTLAGRAPWSRARVGDHRLIFRRLTAAEMRSLGRSGAGYLVERIIHRRDLERVVGRL